MHSAPPLDLMPLDIVNAYVKHDGSGEGVSGETSC